MSKAFIPTTNGPLKSTYDVVVIGGGVHGLSTGYHLAESGKKVVVLDRSYLGSGASGRNIASTRSNYANPAWVKLFWEARKAWETISVELDINVMFTPRGYVLCVLTEAGMDAARKATTMQQSLGVPTELLTPDDVKKMVPNVDTSKVLGAAYDPTAGTSRHDALIWGYARAAVRAGAELHSNVKVTGIKLDGDRIAGVETTAGEISAPIVVNAAGAGSREVGLMAGVDIPTQIHPLEIGVSESYKPFIDVFLSFLEAQLYMIQTARGEFVLGSELSGAHGDQLGNTYDWLRNAAKTYVDVVPALGGVSLVRSWAGLLDMSPDAAGLVGEIEERPGFFLDCGWGGYGYMAAVVTGRYVANYINTGYLDPVLEPFHYTRFAKGKPIPDALLPVDFAGDTLRVPMES